MDDGMVHVLLVEDDEIDAESVMRMLGRDVGFEVTHVDRLSTAMAQIAGASVDLVLLDLGLPDSTGLGGVARILTEGADVPIVVLTGADDSERGLMAVREGAQDYLVKGKINADALIRAVRYASERHRFGAERKEAQEALAKLNEELEMRVEARTEELAEVNKELEAFAYSVSHDLQAPLRSINGFSEILMEDYTDVLDDVGQDYLKRVQTGAVRMEQSINAMLNYSRQSRGDLQIQEVNLSAMASEIIKELCEADPDRAVVLEIAENVTAMGDRRMLHVVLGNLLGNAWKFTAKGNTTHIAFGRTCNGQGDGFFVRDNGAGFDMKYADRLFEPFRRLHSESEFLGSGIGLATVQRIVHRHGGNIWAEGAVGKGATFYFSV